MKLKPINWVADGTPHLAVVMDITAQKEIQELAHMVSKVIAPLFPFGWEALTGE